MEIALGIMLKLGFFNYVIAQPNDNDEHYPQKLRVDRMVRSWILNIISNDLAGSYLYFFRSA